MEIDVELKKKRQEASAHSMGMSLDVIYDEVVNVLRRKKADQGLLLDFGAGRGQFLEMIKSQFEFELHGIDLMHTQLEGIQWFVHDLNQRFPLGENNYDVVTAIEVIEHLENPRHMLRDLFKVLKPGGRLVVTTPNNESWRSLLSYVVRGHFVAFTESSYPAHITALNRMDLIRILKESGFEDIEFSYTNEGMLPKVSKLTWQSCSMGLLKGLRYSDNLIVSAIKP